MTYAIDNDDIAHQVFLEWSTTPPTVPGWYWAKLNDESYNNGNEKIQVVLVNKGGLVLMVEDDSPNITLAFSHWLGPLPIPEPPK